MTRSSLFGPDVDDRFDDGDGWIDNGDYDHQPQSFLRRYRFLIAGVAVVVLALVAVWAIVFSSLFGVRSIDVHGNHAVSTATIRATADIADGTPLVRLDTGAVVRRIEKLPDIAEVRVSTSFPSTVDITVVERHAVAYVRSGSGYVLVDRSGVQFRPTTVKPAALPLLSVPSGPDAQATGAAESTVAVALTSAPAAARERITSISALSPTSITLQCTKGLTVRWGSAARSADKARLLLPLMKQKPSTNGVPVPPSVIDVSNPDIPFIR